MAEPTFQGDPPYRYRMAQRGAQTEAQVLASSEVPAERELVIAQDTLRVWVGDGVNASANLKSGVLGGGSGGGGGADGVGISGASVNDAGHLILQLTNGQSIDTGLVRGADGSSSSASDAAIAALVANDTSATNDAVEVIVNSRLANSGSSVVNTVAYDALGVRALDTLQQFLKWLDKNNLPHSHADIGEWGVPSPLDSTAADGVQYDPRYKGINMVVLDAITRAGLSFTQWTTSAWVQSMRAYVPAVDGGEIAAVTEVGQVIEQFMPRGALNGVNLSGHEFGVGINGMTGNTPVPGRENYDYRWPTAGEVTYMAKRGVKRFRLNLGWERIQRFLGGPLDDTAVTRMTAIADAALAAGATVTLDLHNYGRYTPSTGATALRLGEAIPGTVATAVGITTMNDAFVDVWQRLATLFKNHAGVEGFALMNEPHDLPAPPPDQYNSNPQGFNQWQQASAAAAYAIQAITGATKRIRLNGYGYASARDWDDNNGGNPWLYNDYNGQQLSYASHIIWEAHFYANGGNDDYSATYDTLLANARTDVYKGTTTPFGNAAGSVKITTGGPGGMGGSNVVPDQTGHAGQALSTDGTTPVWVPFKGNLPDQTGQAGKVLGTDGTTTSWSGVGTIDQLSVPLASSGSGNPGTSTKAAAADHVHPAPPSQVQPLWVSASDAVISLPRAHSDDSGSYGSTPAAGVAHFTFLRADKDMLVSKVRFQTGGTAAGSTTLAKIGLYAYVNGVLTLVASSANMTKFAGTYQGQTATLTAAYKVLAGQTYAVAILQAGAAPAALLGQWFNGTYLGASPALAQTLASQADLPATANGLSPQQFPVYYELVA
jgi:hypothetical protein